MMKHVLCLVMEGEVVVVGSGEEQAALVLTITQIFE